MNPQRLRFRWSPRALSRRAPLRIFFAAVFAVAAAVAICAGAPAALAQTPTPPRPPALVPLDQAFLRAAKAVFDKVEPGRETAIVIDPLVDGVTGAPSVATRGLDRRIAAYVAEHYPHVKVLDFTPENVARARFVFIGTFNPINNAGQPAGERDAYWICFALVDRESASVFARGAARAPIGGADVSPAPGYASAPAWGLDAAVKAYIEACQRSQPGSPVDRAYLDQLPAAARIREAVTAYEAGQYDRSRDLYREAKGLQGGDQLRVLNGLYLSFAALGDANAAAAAFSDIVERGFAVGKLDIMFLFQPNSTEFNADRRLSGGYPGWLRAIAARAEKSGSCLRIVGHASRTGAESLNEKLSLERARRIAALLAGESPAVSEKLRASGVGYRETLVGLRRDDASTAVDRRVEFRTAPCA